jgi:hypothetical protein
VGAADRPAPHVSEKELKKRERLRGSWAAVDLGWASELA